MPHLLLSLILAVPHALAADPWHTDLFLPGHDTWHARIPLDLTNASGIDLAGFPVTVKVGEGADEVPLVGANARSVRVCDARGVEMLFDLRGPGGERLEDGPIPRAAALTVPLTAAAGETQRLYVYFDNPEAYLLPEYLSARVTADSRRSEGGEATNPDRSESQGGYTWGNALRHRPKWYVTDLIRDSRGLVG
ncbi:MAG: hypothetical protein FJX75_12120 [Armatimonadetes bacterium]|nr:hypothetical protein [Armatimonadota bacterium]